MEFVLIHHSAAEHRRVNMDRVPKMACGGETVGKTGELSERELVLVVSVGCGKKCDMTRGGKFFGTQRCAIPSLPALEPRVFVWRNVIKLCNSVRAVFVDVLFTPPVGCLEFSL